MFRRVCCPRDKGNVGVGVLRMKAPNGLPGRRDARTRGPRAFLRRRQTRQRGSGPVVDEEPVVVDEDPLLAHEVRMEVVDDQVVGDAVQEQGLFGGHLFHAGNRHGSGEAVKPCAGANVSSTVGKTLNAGPLDVPPGVTTVTGPVTAPTGTSVCKDIPSAAIESIDAATDPNLTLVAPSSVLP